MNAALFFVQETHIREQKSESSVPCPLGLYVLAKTESEIGTEESRWMKLKEEDATVAESHPLSCRHTRHKGGVSLEAAHLPCPGPVRGRDTRASFMCGSEQTRETESDNRIWFRGE